MLQGHQDYIKWIVTASDFSNLSESELDKWQNVYNLGLKSIAKERGKREILNEYRQRAKRLYTSMHQCMKQMENFIYTTESGELTQIDEESSACYDTNKNIVKDNKGNRFDNCILI